MASSEAEVLAIEALVPTIGPAGAVSRPASRNRIRLRVPAVVNRLGRRTDTMFPRKSVLRSRVRRALVLLPVVAAGLVVASPAAQAEFPEGTFQIASLDPDHKGRCLNMQGDSTLQTVPCKSEAKRQHWKLSDTYDSGSGRAGMLMNVLKKLCVGRNPSGAPVGANCHYNPALAWWHQSDKMWIASRPDAHTDMCLAAGAKVGEPVRLISCRSTNQSKLQWEIRPLD
ncbi:RICIN domain-containing protein [Nocardia sp. CDC159]|uniref:RICIN domain-containing protein n=1 Tax=Nocardia pulmonis TaxID=2951408 RepID=A0A9X2IZS7_9NOCA|nr:MULTISPECIES: RICIN domain-containing protein [Nocardia]MCM6775271.1 RICIN domain-containing protein [Nocardia pulmonis]MCM6787995.1 RICIN domain-containing protein [Nocardia sp. CDC159]